jgi:hypothetical protein
MHTTMMSSQEWIEVKGPDLLLKVIQSKKQGEDVKPVKSGDTVLMNLIGRQADSPDHVDGSVFQEVKSWLVTVGEPYCLVRALEYGLEHMLAGQTAYIYSTSKYNFDGIRKYKASPTAEEYTLPANSNVVYEVTATQIVMDTSRLNPYFTIQRALTMKNIANDIYKCEFEAGGNPRERAIHLYEKAGKAMKTLLQGTYFSSVEESHPQRKESRTIMLDCLNNVIAVYLRAKRWQKARDAASAVLREDSKNTKALLRRAKASLLDPDLTMEEKDQALEKAENVIMYKDAEEGELRKLRAQWQKKQAAA